MEKRIDQQSRTESKTQLVEQINSSLRSGHYSRALDLLLRAAAEFPNDVELSELEKLAHDGVTRNAEAQRLITESQELFAERKSAEAIQLLRKAYELDKHNSLARAILANAVVEQAHSLVETDWLEAEKLTNQALALNPAHPSAKTVLGLIVIKKETSPVRQWVSQARKLQSSGDLFAALAWVAEGLAVHPHEPQLLQIQDEIQRDQEAQRRQARRGDLDELRRLQREIDAAADVAAKQALAERIQAVAAKHWTDGEILSIANALLLRLGLVPQESSGASPRSKGATVILHVPRPSTPTAAPADSNPIVPAKVSAEPVLPSPLAQNQTSPSQALPRPAALDPVPPRPVVSETVATVPEPSSEITPCVAPTSKVPPSKVPSSQVPLRSAPRGKVRIAPPELLPQPATVLMDEPPAAAAKVTSRRSQPIQVKRSNSATLAVASAVAIIFVAATLYFVRKHYAPPVAKPPAAAPTVSTPAASAQTPAISTPAQTPEPSRPDLPVSSDNAVSATTTGKVPPDNQPAPGSVHNVGTILVVAGQDDARVFLNGKLQPQLTRAGQLRLPNLDLKDYVVQVSKSGFPDPPPQTIRLRKGEQATLAFNLQPQLRFGSLTIRGGAPGTTVLIDQTPVGIIQPDGTLSVSTVNPGDHTVELRKERFKPRQWKKHFVAGETISLAASDAVLEPAPAQLKITFAPADAVVAISKGELPMVIKSGVPLNLAAGTYTLTARTADRFTRSSTFEVIPGQSKTLDLSLAPNGMSKWDDRSAWKEEGDSFIRKGGDFVLYGAVPASGTFSFSVMLTKGHLLQWVLDYTDSRNYVLCQMDDNYFYRSVVRNGEKTNEIRVTDKSDKKSFRDLHIRVSATEIVNQIKHGNSWTVLDRWTQPGANLSLGKFGFYIPGNDQVALSGFAHYADLNIR